ncbi:MAG: hypothetical protein IJC33_05370 [Clostridia bacterium]|nr:hypothetical protein [Clostridia bacterium]
MKKAMALLLGLVWAVGLTACGGRVRGVQITECASEIYTEEEIRQAIDVVLQDFKRDFEGCTLLEIGYAGDDRQDGWQEFAQRHGADQVIVLLSEFYVDDSGRSQGLNPHSTYTGWNWILVRNKGGQWRHVDHGY